MQKFTVSVFINRISAGKRALQGDFPKLKELMEAQAL